MKAASSNLARASLKKRKKTEEENRGKKTEERRGSDRERCKNRTRNKMMLNSRVENVLEVLCEEKEDGPKEEENGQFSETSRSEDELSTISTNRE